MPGAASATQKAFFSACSVHVAAPLDPVAHDEPGLLPQRVRVHRELQLEQARRKVDGATTVEVSAGGRICSLTSTCGVTPVSGCM